MMMMVVVVAHDAHQPVGLALSGTDGCCTSRCRPVRSALLCRDISSSPCPPKVQVISVPGRHPACSLTTCFPPPIRAPPKPATARHADSGRNRTASTSQAPPVCRASQTRALTTIDITQGPGDGPAVCSVGSRARVHSWPCMGKATMLRRLDPCCALHRQTLSPMPCETPARMTAVRVLEKGNRLMSDLGPSQPCAQR